MQLVYCGPCAGFVTREHAVYPPTNAWRPIAPPWHIQLKVRLDMYCQVTGYVSQRKRTRRRASLKNIRRSENGPFRPRDRVHFPQRLAPAENTLLARVYFLATADQADAGTPIRMPGHQIENERWLRRGPFEFFDALLLIPGALCLVENNDMLMGRRVGRPTEALLEKIIDVLNSGAHFATNGPQRPSLSNSPAPQIFISRQSLAKYYDQGCITREIDDITILLHAGCHSAMNNMQPRESFPRTRYARQDQQEPLLLLTCLFDQRHKSRGC